jgi:hypothetical protein
MDALLRSRKGKTIRAQRELLIVCEVAGCVGEGGGGEMYRNIFSDLWALIFGELCEGMGEGGTDLGVGSLTASLGQEERERWADSGARGGAGSRDCPPSGAVGSPAR